MLGGREYQPMTIERWNRCAQLIMAVRIQFQLKEPMDDDTLSDNDAYQLMLALLPVLRKERLLIVGLGLLEEALWRNAIKSTWSIYSDNAEKFGEGLASWLQSDRLVTFNDQVRDAAA
jgi:hypothetical protein